MKITVGRLKTIIQEEFDNFKKLQEDYVYKRDEEAEEDSEEAPAEPEEPEHIQQLKDILAKWEEAEYESDESRWQEYAKDIQGMIDQLDGEEEHDCDCDHEDHAPHDCDCEHSEKSHEEREGEEESPKPKKKSKPKEKKEKGEESGGPKKAGKGGKSFP